MCNVSNLYRLGNGTEIPSIGKQKDLHLLQRNKKN